MGDDVVEIACDPFTFLGTHLLGQRRLALAPRPPGDRARHHRAPDQRDEGYVVGTAGVGQAFGEPRHDRRRDGEGDGSAGGDDPGCVGQQQGDHEYLAERHLARRSCNLCADSKDRERRERATTAPIGRVRPRTTTAATSSAAYTVVQGCHVSRPSGTSAKASAATTSPSTISRPRCMTEA